MLIRGDKYCRWYSQKLRLVGEYFSLSQISKNSSSKFLLVQLICEISSLEAWETENVE